MAKRDGFLITVLSMIITNSISIVLYKFYILVKLVLGITCSARDGNCFGSVMIMI